MKKEGKSTTSKHKNRKNAVSPPIRGQGKGSQKVTPLPQLSGNLAIDGATHERKRYSTKKVSFNRISANEDGELKPLKISLKKFKIGPQDDTKIEAKLKPIKDSR